jgi:hypothetical protein
VRKGMAVVCNFKVQKLLSNFMNLKLAVLEYGPDKYTYL